MATIVRQMLKDNGVSDFERIPNIPLSDAQEFLTQCAFDALLLDNPHWEIKWDENSVSVIDQTCGFRLDYTVTED